MIGFLGGTGPEGRDLALRLALAGEDVIIGSRDGSRAAAVAEEVAGLAPGAVVEGALNEETAAAGRRRVHSCALLRAEAHYRAPGRASRGQGRRGGHCTGPVQQGRSVDPAGARRVRGE